MSVSKQRINCCVTNDLTTDQRMHRMASSLVDMGFDVTLTGRRKRNSLPLPQENFRMVRMNLLFQKSFLFYAEYNFRLFFHLLSQRPAIILAVDLDSLPASFLASSLLGCKLVYDAHELFCEVPELVHRPFIKKVWHRLEKFLLPRIRCGITVNRYLAQYFKENYGLDMKVVRNVPRRFQPENYVEMEIPEIQTKKVILYQGSVNMGRGIELMVDAMEFMEDVLFVILGTGDEWENIRRRVKQKSIQHKVYMPGRIPPWQLPAYTRKATLGISIEENLGLNYYYALPNKLFDYIQAGVPVLVSPFPAMKEIVEEYSIGQFLNSRDPRELAMVLKEMLNNTEALALWKENLKAAAEELCWEREEKSVRELFAEFLPTGGIR